MEKVIIYTTTAILLIFFIVDYFYQRSEKEFYKEHAEISIQLINESLEIIDSLKTVINTLSTDTITIDEWKYYGDTIQYIGNDSIIMTYPVKYYRLIVTANEQTKNQTLSIESEFYNDTIIKTIN